MISAIKILIYPLNPHPFNYFFSQNPHFFFICPPLVELLRAQTLMVESGVYGLYNPNTG